MTTSSHLATHTAPGFLLALALAAAPAAQADSIYVQHNLVSDGVVTADHTDANLVNAWGIAFNPTGVVWIADNGTGVSTLYDGTGTAVDLTVVIPKAANNTEGADPTGIVFNNTTNAFATSSGPSKFIFASEDGSISAWTPGDPSQHVQNATLEVDNSKTTGAVYKGLALGADGTQTLLYAADFHNNRIDVFDSMFHPVSLPGAFKDPRLPAGFAPFGIRNLDGNIYVTYAKQDKDKHDDVAGRGNGFVNVFDPKGALIQRIAARGPLNSPWGLAIAPAGFGSFSHRLLVGNFGDGHINAYDLESGEFAGQLRDSHGKALHIDGLWGLAFGDGYAMQSVNTLFFTAGPGDEQHGLYGKIDVKQGSTHFDTQGRDDDD